MTINALTSVGIPDRLYSNSTELLGSAGGRASSVSAFEAADSISLNRLTSTRSFAAELNVAIEQIKFENEKLLIREDNSLEAEEERIKNVNEAEQAIQFASYKILSQSGAGMITPTNLLPASALHLLA
jgi:flagellin-like hook-associated protein FlgL